MNATFHPFLDALIKEISEAFKQIQFLVNFTITGTTKLQRFNVQKT